MRRLYKKGAFTCAETNKAGYFDIADKGTLFLDEISNMSLNTQMKLLRAIEGKGYMPIGNNRIQNSCFRIITATNINLLECVAKGLMRKDFFYRINVISINIPPLRKRKEDIPLLVEYYLEKNNAVELFDFVNEKISSNLKHYDWPGNVRELQNLIMRLLTFKNKKIWNDMEIKGIEAENITDEIIQQDFLTFNMAVEKYEKNLILNALEQNQWHRGKTACSLGLSRRTFYRKLEKYEIISQ
ncbi:sigma 54-interacting transcriptional regulator [Desulfonema limicola]|nr:sigma 54-interacting transcriptional regulator [Desulfonema limicola]